MPPKPAPAKKPAKGAAAKTTKTKTAAKAGDKKTEAKAAPAEEPKMVEGIEISLKEIGAVMENKNDKINASGRWPVVVDEVERVGAFLRHRDCNYLDALDTNHMDTDRIRLALLGGLRFGKPMVIDLLGSDVWTMVAEKLDQIQPGLCEAILDKSVMKEDRYMSLVKESDNAEFSNQFAYLPDVMARFVFLVLTSNHNTPHSLNTRTIKVTVT